MNREIKFRGKTLDTGEWVYGDIWQPNTSEPLRHRFGEVYIHSHVDGSLHQVDPETVGQLTGLPDKNGREIWEGDIIEASDFLLGDSFTKANIGSVVFNDGGFKVTNEHKNATRLTNEAIEGYSVAVIGNIHDNPELLTKK